MEQCASWRAVTDQRVADELIALARAFHDGVVSDARWVSGESLNRSRELEVRGFGTLELAVDSQFMEVPRVELRFRGVRQFRYDYDYDSDGAIEISPGSVAAKLLTWKISAEGMDYRAPGMSEEPDSRV